MDLEALETLVRAAAHAAGARLLQELLEPVGVGKRDAPVRCVCGCAMRSGGTRVKQVQTLMGPIDFTRSRYECPRCGAACYPGDRELCIEDTSRSPGVRRQVSRLGAKESFCEVSRDMRELAGVAISRKDAERVSERTGAAMEACQERERSALRLAGPPPPETPKTIETLYVEFDGTGVPMVAHELAGRKGKQADGGSKTREAKLGCVFTQHAFDEKGHPVRDPNATSFTGAIEAAAPFGKRIYAEAVRRGLFQARQTVVLGDGAAWVKNLAQEHFGHATFIVDFYHAAEHIGALCRALFDRDLRKLDRYQSRWREYLNDGEIESIVQEASAWLPKDPKTKKDARTQIAYFDKNKAHMRYGQFREQGLFIGSGVIEAGCKTVVGQRLKQSAMKWTVRGANDIIALRCTYLSNRQEEFWEAMTA